MCMPIAKYKPEGGVICPRTRVIEGCEPPCGCWDPNLASLQTANALKQGAISLVPALQSAHTFLKKLESDLLYDSAIPYMLNGFRILLHRYPAFMCIVSLFTIPRERSQPRCLSRDQ